MRRPVRIIGIPMDLGQTQRGVDMGAAALRYAGLAGELRRIGYEVRDTGDIMVPVRDSLATPDDLTGAIARVSSDTYHAVAQAVRDGDTPLCIGGDHSIAVGTVGGVTDSGPCGILWIDAHADFNTPVTSPSGNVHGMALALLVGEGDDRLLRVGRNGAKIEPRDVILVGVRDLDAGERDRLRESGIAVFTMREIDEWGMASVIREALDRLGHRSRLHVSLDIDVLDPQIAPGAGTLVPGGLSYREAQLMMEIIGDRGGPDSMDIVEINPIIDSGNRTARMAVELALSAFGKQIL